MSDPREGRCRLRDDLVSFEADPQHAAVPKEDIRLAGFAALVEVRHFSALPGSQQ